MIERIDFSTETAYSAVESTIHLCRYAIAKPYIQGKYVLDAASGQGYGSYLLRKWGAEHVEAMDVDEATVNKASKLFGSDEVCFRCHNVEELPFEDCTFDVVCSFETIEHLDHPEKFLKEIKRVLKPGGTIIVSCPNDPYYYKQGTPGNPFHKRQYNFFDFKFEAEAILGSHVQYYLAFALNGFINLPLERATLPPEGNAPDPLPRDMFEMLNYDECDNSIVVSGERYLNYWNSNYYVGIWGKSSKPQINASMYPRETFIELTDTDIEFYREAHKLKEEVEILRCRLLEKKQEIDGLTNAQEILNGEKNVVKQKLGSYTAMLREKEEALQKEYILREVLEQRLEAKEKEIAVIREEKNCAINILETELKEYKELLQQRNTLLEAEMVNREELKRKLEAKEKEVVDMQEKNRCSMEELEKEICDLKDQLASSEAYIAYLKDTSKQEMHVAKIEQQRISMMLDLVTKEKECLSQNAYSNYMALMTANHAKEEAEKWGQGLSSELCQTQEALARANRELELIKSSRGFKLLNIGFPIKKRIWKLFGKDI